MSITSRMFSGDEDRDRVIHLLSEMRASDPTGPYWHPGSVMWDMYMRADVAPGSRFRLWEDDAADALVAVGWLENSTDEIAMQLAPSVHGTNAGVTIVAEGVTWARRQANHTPTSDLWGLAFDSDAWYRAQLEANGCQLDAGHPSYVHFQQPLRNESSPANPLPANPLPAGVTVRAVGGPEEWQRRVDVHREAFAPSRFTLAGYRNVRAAPNYRPDLDLVAVAPDGDFAAYCLVWYDPASRGGEYEPVGAHPAWRRQGVTRATLTEGLRRLRALGAEWASVMTSSDNTPAIRPYESVGFTRQDEEIYYRIAL